MELKIVWTPQAEKGLEKTIRFLEEKWSDKEIKILEEKTTLLLQRISKQPNFYPTSNKHKNLHKGLIDKHNYIIYRFRQKKGVIEVINFRATKRRPL